MRTQIIAFTLLIAALNGCGNESNNSSRGAQGSAPTEVETVAVVSRQLDLTVNLPAQLLPYESVDIYPKVTGFLESIRVDVGSRVRQGEELMRLSAPELLAQRSQAEAAMHAAESQLATAQARLASNQGTYAHLAAAAKTPGVVAPNDVMVADQTVAADKNARR